MTRLRAGDRVRVALADFRDGLAFAALCAVIGFIFLWVLP